MSKIEYTLPDGTKLGGARPGKVAGKGSFGAGWLKLQDDATLADWGIAKEVLPDTVVPPPAPPEAIQPNAFYNRFTDAERTAIRTASKANAALEDWVWNFLSATTVGLKDLRTIGGLDALVAAGLLTEDRKNEILTP